MKTKTALELVQQIAQGNISEEVADHLIAQAEEIDRLRAKLEEIKEVLENFYFYNEEGTPFLVLGEAGKNLYEISEILKDVEGEDG